LAPARSGDTLEIVTCVREIRGARSIWIQEIRESASQRLLVTAEVTGAFATEDGRPARTPASFRERLSAICVPGAAVAEGQARAAQSRASPPAITCAPSVARRRVCTSP